MTQRLFLTVGCALAVCGAIFYAATQTSYLLAAAGNANAQRKQGDIAVDAQRYEAAAGWYRRAAGSGDLHAYAKLGNMFLKGAAKPESDYEGFKAYLHAVQAENYKAQPAFCRYATYSADHVLPAPDKARAICGNAYMPLVMDMDGRGIQIRGVAEKQYVYFDLADNQFAVITDWLDGNDGFLVHDKNENGYVDSAREMIAGRLGEDHPNGFIALAAYDTDGDQKITPKDNDWHDLSVWIDKAPYGFDGLGVGQELYALSDLGIESIDLAYRNIDDAWGETAIWQSGTFMRKGRKSEILGLRFWTKPVYSQYTGKVSIPKVLHPLPNISGQGQLKALRVQMALDRQNKAPRRLDYLVYRLYATKMEDLFLPSNNLEQQILDILFRWAAVDDIAPASRGKNIDARALAFVEAVTANKFLQRGVTFDPRPHAALNLKESFSKVFAAYSGALLVQGDAKQLFSGAYVYYDSRQDGLRGATGLEDAALAKLVEIAKKLPDRAAREIFWQRVSLLVRTTFNSVTHAEVYMQLMQAIKASDANLDAGRIIKVEQSYVNMPLVDPQQTGQKSP